MKGSREKGLMFLMVRKGNAREEVEESIRCCSGTNPTCSQCSSQGLICIVFPFSAQFFFFTSFILSLLTMPLSPVPIGDFSFNCSLPLGKQIPFSFPLGCLFALRKPSRIWDAVLPENKKNRQPSSNVPLHVPPCCFSSKALAGGTPRDVRIICFRPMPILLHVLTSIPGE